MKPTTLDSCTTGKTAQVKSVVSQDVLLKSKLLSMGLVAGTNITILEKAPLGDPIKIKALGYTLSLRCSEAACIQIDQ